MQFIPINKLSITFIILLLFGANQLSAQKMIRMDNTFNSKTKKYYVGEELTFKIEGEKEWITEEIVDILADENVIRFENRLISPDNITAIKSFAGDRPTKILSVSLYSFGASWLFWSLAGILAGTPITWLAPIVSGSAALIGWVTRLLFKTKVYHIGRRRVLRLIDITFP